MRISLILLVVCVVQLKGSVYSQHQQVSLDLKNCSVEQLFRVIKKQTGVHFIYKNDYVKNLGRFDVQVKDKELKELMQEVFDGTDIYCRFEEDVIVVMKKEPQQQNTSSNVLKGRVLDRKGDPLPGASIVIKGTQVGFVTDAQGRYSIPVPDKKDAILIFSFMGMESKEIRLSSIKEPEMLTGQRNYDVTLVEVSQSLDDVVVTGFNNIKKESYTGDAVRVTGEEIMRVSSRNIFTALEVFDPSFRISVNNKMGSNPNYIPDFSIRGESSIGDYELDVQDLTETRLRSNANRPLFIIDGLYVSVEDVFDLDLERVHSTTILKDAAATAIYGSRASNGVIVIETKKPLPGKFNFSYRGGLDITAPDLSSYDYFNAAEKLEVEKLTGYYEIDPTVYSQTVRLIYSELMKKEMALAKGVDTYWLSQPLRVGYNHKHSLTMDGGNDNIRYSVNFRYDGQKGVMKDDYRNRLGVGMQFQYKVDNVSVTNDFQFNKTMYENSPYGSFSTFVNQLPYNEMKNAFGNYVKQFPVWHSGSQYTNPMYEGAETKNFNNGSSEQYKNNFLVTWQLPSGSLFDFRLGLTRGTNKSRRFIDPASGSYDHTRTKHGDLWTTDGSSFNWSMRLMYNFNRKLGKNYITVTPTFELAENRSNSVSAKYMGFPSGSLSSIMYAQEIDGKPSETDNISRTGGVALRGHYSYDNIYLCDISVRFDGSSEFGSDKKYAPFWSAGFGLNFHNYAFLKDRYLSQLKLTATFGQTGTTNFPPYAAKDIYSIFSESWYVTGMGVQLIALGNSNLEWQIKDSYTYSLEFALKKKLLTGKITYFREITKKQITDVAIPSSFGFTSYKDNMGKILNEGVELTLSTNIVNTRDLFVSVNGSFTHRKNTIKEISNSMKRYNDRVEQYYANYYATSTATDWTIPLRKYEEGASTTSLWGMKSLGIDPTSGEEVYVRRDGTITYEWSAAENQVLGDELAKGEGFLYINAQWKGFTLFTAFQYSFGGDAYNTTYVNRVENVDLLNYNADKRVLTDRWREIGDLTPLKDIATRSHQTRPTSRFLQRNNFIDFTSLSLGYSFRDHEWMKHVFLKDVMLEFNMSDVAHLSTVKRERGTDYPFARTFEFSMRVRF